MKIAVYSVGTPEYNIEETAKVLKELGYDAVEWRVDTIGVPAYFANMKEIPFGLRYWMDNKSTLDVDNIMEDALRAKKACDEVGLEICNLATSTGYVQPERLENCLQAAKAIGCKTIRACMMGYDAKKSEKGYNEICAEMRAELEKLQPHLKELGIKVLLETHHGNVIASASAGFRILNGLDPDCFGLIFDPGNMVFEGYEDYRKSFELLGPYLAHVHVKNAALVPDGEDEFGATKWKQDWTQLHKGSANLRDLVEALDWIGYDGYLSIEDFNNYVPTYEKLVENLAYMRKLVDSVKK